MIRIPGRYRPSSYFPSFNSRLVKYRTELFLGGTALLLFLLVSGSLSVFAQRGTGRAPALLSIAVTPADASIFPDRMEQFTARGMYSDGRTHDLTRRVTWSSSALDVATIGREGLARTVGEGQTTIEAAVGAIKGSTTLNVASFVLTGSMNTVRYWHTGTLLNSGMVLIAGGLDDNNVIKASAELYNLATGTFSYTGSMNTARYWHTGTLLNNGLVLEAGGGGGGATAELYNPATATFTTTGSMNTARLAHTATLLNNGLVLIAGGLNGSVLASAELYNPATGTFSYTGSMNTDRYEHTATLLNNGLVLIAGGIGSNGATPLASAELYNPSTGTFSYTTGSLNTARDYFTATLLNNGTVLLAAGYNGFTVTSAELYDPASETFTYTTGSLNTPRYGQSATLLSNGLVLIAGGGDFSYPYYLSSGELYNPATGAFSYATGSMNTARYLDTATLLNNGLVLMAGGFPWSSLNSAELYGPATLTPADLESIAITPERSTLFPGATRRFIATGAFSDGSTQQLASVTWSSWDPRVAQISNDASNHGVALAIAAGTSIIEARAGRVRGWARLTVR